MLNGLFIQIRKALMLNKFRTWYYEKDNLYFYTQCISSFVNRMNTMSAEFGMTSTKWINPSGLGEDGRYSYSTARDLAILGLHASQCIELNDIWHKRLYSYRVRRPFIWPLNNTILRDVKSTIQPIICDNDIEIIGGKTGSGDGYNTLLIVAKICGELCSAVVMEAASDLARFDAMREVLLLAKCLILNTPPCVRSVNSARCACVYAFHEQQPICLFEQNADVVTVPMSITKVMTSLVALRYLDIGSDAKFRVLLYDIGQQPNSGYHPKEWEVLSIQDLFYEMLLASSNIAANVIARYIGHKLLETNNN